MQHKINTVFIGLLILSGFSFPSPDSLTPHSSILTIENVYAIGIPLPAKSERMSSRNTRFSGNGSSSQGNQRSGGLFRCGGNDSAGGGRERGSRLEFQPGQPARNAVRAVVRGIGRLFGLGGRRGGRGGGGEDGGGGSPCGSGGSGSLGADSQAEVAPEGPLQTETKSGSMQSAAAPVRPTEMLRPLQTPQEPAAIQRTPPVPTIGTKPTEPLTQAMLPKSEPGMTLDATVTPIQPKVTPEKNTPNTTTTHDIMLQSNMSFKTEDDSAKMTATVLKTVNTLAPTITGGAIYNPQEKIIARWARISPEAPRLGIRIIPEPE
ncbi:MAG: hypothetical protein WCI77_10785 [Candidatus Omnitrophota bacterium]